MIKTKSIYDNRDESHGTRILITVVNPPAWLEHYDWKQECGSRLGHTDEMEI